MRVHRYVKAVPGLLKFTDLKMTWMIFIHRFLESRLQQEVVQWFETVLKLTNSVQHIMLQCSRMLWILNTILQLPVCRGSKVSFN